MVPMAAQKSTDRPLWAISFLGRGNYRRVCYNWQESDNAQTRSFITDIMPEAVLHIFQPARLIIAVTPQARDTVHAQYMLQQYKDHVELLEIPNGQNVEELWQIFDVITRVDFPERARVLIDVTHAFRSIPLMAVAIAAYLRRVRSLEIERIVYGAFEAVQSGEPVPIFDLTPLVHIIDWLEALTVFQETGDPGLMVSLGERAYRQIPLDPATRRRPGRKIQNLFNQMQSLTKAIRYLQVPQIGNYAHRVSQLLDAASKDIDRWVRPFAAIVRSLRTELDKLKITVSDKLTKEMLQQQYNLMVYYIERHRYEKAILCAREWIINWVLYRAGKVDEWLDRASREEVSACLSRYGHRSEKDDLPEWAQKIPSDELEKVRELFGQMTIRNDIAHCGFRKGTARLNRIETNTHNLIYGLRELLDQT